jgi:pimeloyl-ACP methyl ester carboxylesterase
MLSWDVIQPRLADHATVTAYDWGGHGCSEMPARPFAIADLATQLAELITRAGDSGALLYGVAAGAAIALQCAIDFPGLAARLVLGSPTAAVSAEVGAGMRRRLAAVREDGMRAAVEASTAAGFPVAFRRAQPEVIARYRHEFLTTAPAAYAASSEAFSYFNVTALLGAVSCPVVLLPGVEDPYFPTSAATHMGQFLSDCQIRPLDGVGHFQHIQVPARVVAEIQRASSSQPSKE